MWLTTRKKKVALLACREVCGSKVSCPWCSPWAGITGVVLSFLMSYEVLFWQRMHVVARRFTFLRAL